MINYGLFPLVGLLQMLAVGHEGFVWRLQHLVYARGKTISEMFSNDLRIANNIGKTKDLDVFLEVCYYFFTFAAANV